MAGPVRLLCLPASAAGFGLAGIAADPVAPGSDPMPRIEAVLQECGAGVLLIEESLYDAVPAELRNRLERSIRPVVVPFPGPRWGEAAGAEARVVELLRRAIGYRVRFS